MINRASREKRNELFANRRVENGQRRVKTVKAYVPYIVFKGDYVARSCCSMFVNTSLSNKFRIR